MFRFTQHDKEFNMTDNSTLQKTLKHLRHCPPQVGVCNPELMFSSKI